MVVPRSTATSQPDFAVRYASDISGSPGTQVGKSTDMQRISSIRIETQSSESLWDKVYIARYKSGRVSETPSLAPTVGGIDWRFFSERVRR